jgi:hypothetical protein
MAAAVEEEEEAAEAADTQGDDEGEDAPGPGVDVAAVEEGVESVSVIVEADVAVVEGDGGSRARQVRDLRPDVF